MKNVYNKQRETFKLEKEKQKQQKKEQHEPEQQQEEIQVVTNEKIALTTETPVAAENVLPETPKLP